MDTHYVVKIASKPSKNSLAIRPSKIVQTFSAYKALLANFKKLDVYRSPETVAELFLKHSLFRIKTIKYVSNLVHNYEIRSLKSMVLT